MRLSCRLNVLQPRAIDGNGWPIGQTEACQRCQGCDNKGGELGLTGFEEISLKRSHGDVLLFWSCPSCGCEVTEETSALQAIQAAKLVDADRLCYRCRRT
jgi:hypothetical protein